MIKKAMRKNFLKIDERIKQSISESLAADERINPVKIRIRVSGGLVELTGTVRNEEARRVAGDIAKSLPQINQVQNYIAVIQGPPQNPLSRIA